MATDIQLLKVGGETVEVVRKGIRHLHVGVYPPNGQVRVSAPLRVADDAVRLAVVSHIRWIRRRKADLAAQDRQPEREMVSGESHYVSGRRYQLRLIERAAPPEVRIRSGDRLEVHVRRDTSRSKRLEVLNDWYRGRLRVQIGELLRRWQGVVGVAPRRWMVRRMKTRWGTSNARQGRIWFNLELAKKAPTCVEYIVVHELVHLLTRHHDERFIMLMDRFLPNWRRRRDLLNRLPLAHEEWGY